MQAARRAWIDAQPTLDITTLVFLDETGASTNMTSARGRAPQGAGCIAAVPHGHWKTTTVIVGLRDHDILAPMVLDGPMDGPTFLAYVPQCVGPTLKPIERMFAKLKAQLRKAAKRTVDSLWDEIGQLLSTYSPAECQNYVASSEYHA